MKKVDFFIVGQPKSGTTALAHFLDQHPEICVTAPKEPTYMAEDLLEESTKYHSKNSYFSVRTAEQYAGTYKHAEPYQLVCDASTNYLYSKKAAKRIKAYNKDARIIIMLRNPVDMIYSLHSQYVNETQEDIVDFDTALAAEAKRKRGESIPRRVFTPSFVYYTERGEYYQQVKRFLDEFDKKNILIIFSDDFRRDNAGKYEEALKFLNVKKTMFKPSFEGVHESKKPRSATLNSFMRAGAIKNISRSILGQRNYTWIQKRILEPLLLKQSKRTTMNPNTRRRLEKQFRPDAKKLGSLIGQDLVKRWFS